MCGSISFADCAHGSVVFVIRDHSVLLGVVLGLWLSLTLSSSGTRQHAVAGAMLLSYCLALALLALVMLCADNHSAMIPPDTVTFQHRDNRPCNPRIPTCGQALLDRHRTTVLVAPDDGASCYTNACKPCTVQGAGPLLSL